MATLKSIKNKYLTYADGAGLGVDANTENIAALSFKLATADNLSKFNLVDGFSDDYNDATGVDASSSTDASRDSTDNYYKGLAAVTSSGADSQSFDGDYTVEHFTATGSSTYTTDTAQDYEILIIGGGGGGAGPWAGGGGGAGGYRHFTSHAVTTGNHAVVVGTGGATSSNVNGVASSFNDGATNLVSAGGGWAAGGNLPYGKNGNPGGSGGGAAGTNGTSGSSGNTPSVSPSQGNGGGTGDGGYNLNRGGGGGGAGGGGSGGGPSGNGGNGLQNDIVISGTPVYYAGGGGGGSHSHSGGVPGGTGGLGGGGDGQSSSSPYPDPPGSWRADPNTGGGGGGSGGRAGAYGSPAGAGGSGVVYLRHLTAGAPGPMILQSNTFTAQTPAPGPTTARIILDEETYAGTTTLNTDIKAYASRDGFATAGTQIILASQGDITYDAGIDSYTKLMLNMDGADSGTTFTDSSLVPHTVTAQGSTHTDTTIKKFGTASAQFGGNGTGDDLTIPDSSDWDIGTSDFTFDCWLYPTDSGGSYRKIFASGGWTGPTNEYDWVFDKTDTQKLRLQLYDGTGAPNETSSASIANDVWTHVAAVRSGSTTTLYINGVADSPGGNIAAESIKSHGALQVGRQAVVSSTTQMWQGYIDELRVSIGIARWTSNFTPPSSAYVKVRRLLSGSVDISGQPSGTDMKYKIQTFNQSSTKSTRVYGTSMAWA